MTIRDANIADAPTCAAIYAPYVHDTAVTFEVDAPDATEMAARIVSAQRSHAWLVLEQGGAAVGYAYGSEFKSRAAYRWSCEVSVYLRPGLRRTGAGRALYLELFDRLTARGFRTAVAGMTLPNEASVGLHEALGFTAVGTFRGVGWKNDSWHDVAFVQRELSAGGDPPVETS